MFSQEPRCLMSHNQLSEVVCQLHFPDILVISSELPARFQEAIREEFPQFSARKENRPPNLVGGPGNFRLEQTQPTQAYSFTSADNSWRVTLSCNYISLTCHRYTSWEEFARRLDKPLAALIQIYKPAYFVRVGLRYLNFISRFDLGLEGTPFSQLIQPCYLGPLGEEDVAEASINRCTVDVVLSLRGGCKAKIHAGPGLVKKDGVSDKEHKFIFDQDLYMQGNIPVNLSAGALQTLHSQAFPIFRGAITNTLYNALI